MDFIFYKNYKNLNQFNKGFENIDNYLSVRDSLESMKSNNELLKLKLIKEFENERDR